MKHLDYKILGSDLLVFKNKNDCMTIHDGFVLRIEVDGEDMDMYKDLKNPFTMEEAEYYIDFYLQLQNQGYF